VIVRGQPEVFQIVLQPDHGQLAGDLALAWADRGPRHESLVTAARRHDDGWAVWERSPRVDSDGRPVAVYDVAITSHLAFYRAGIASVTEEDAYAGLLVSMHGAGIYQHRYGSDMTLSMTAAAQAQDQVDAFVAEQEAGHEAAAAALGVDEELRWADYHRLQYVDRLSAAFCGRDFDDPELEPIEIGDYTVEPLGPWNARITPWPLDTPTATFTVPRRKFERRAWESDEFREALLAEQPQLVELTLQA